MKWYAVRHFFRSRIIGRPKRRDAWFVSGISSIEDRITIVTALNRKGAIKKAAVAAREYARRMCWKNAYGQKVVTEVLPYSDSYELDNSPRDGTEIFSSIEIVRKKENLRAYFNRKIGSISDPTTGNIFMAESISSKLDVEAPGWKAKFIKKPAADKSK